MDHLICMVLGGLTGWTATLFLEQRRWLPRLGDLIGGLLGGLLGSAAATAATGATQSADPTNAQTLAALAGAALVVALWRTGRSIATRRTAGRQGMPGAGLSRSAT